MKQSPELAVGWTARYAISRAMSIGAGYGRSALGGAIGYRAGGYLGDYVLSDWDAKIAWAGAFWKPRPGLHLGGGPAWYQLENVPEMRSISRIGLMGEVGSELPANARFFLHLALRVHLIPPKNVEHRSSEPIVLRPNWTHAILLVGLGIHL